MRRILTTLAIMAAGVMLVTAPAVYSQPAPVAAFQPTVLPGNQVYYWIEGEQASQHNFNTRGGYANANRRLCSGNNWLAHEGSANGQAIYQINIPTAGKYTWWLRCTVRTEMEYSVNGSEPVAVNMAKYLDGEALTTNVYDSRVLGWVKVGEFDLPAGEQSFKLVTTTNPTFAGGIDCMNLVNFAWTPNGIMQPDGLVGDPVKETAAITLPPYPVRAQVAPGKGEFIWLEGEKPASSTFINHYWYSNVSADMLFNRGWLSHYGNKPGEAEYVFTVKTPGAYSWWLRCNTAEVTQDYSIDGAPPVPMDLKSVIENASISETRDMRFVGWVKVANLNLTAGEHKVKIITKSEKRNHGGIDSMAFVNFAWKPVGFDKPDGSMADPSGNPDPRLVQGGTLDGKEYIWIEGEGALSQDMNHHGWYGGVNKKLLSNGDWTWHYGATPGTANYKFVVRAGGEYTWWARVMVHQTVLEYRLDGGTATQIDTTDVRERINLPDSLDIRAMGWVRVGKFKLDTGVHRISLTTKSQDRNHGGIDCMALTNFAWAPSGTNRPVLTPEAPAGPDTWFEFNPDDDSFSPESIIDLSSIIHAPAGKFGFVQRKGEHLVLSNQPNTPVKFWGLCASPARTPELQEQQARLYAKHGINMLRKHTVQGEVGLLIKDEKTGQRILDPERLDAFDRWFAILKENGIYMTWSSFYPHQITPYDNYPKDLYDELQGDENSRRTTGVVNFMPQLQDAEWAWLKTILEHRNPYTGIRYVDEPALAVLEVHNEDCIFFHSPLNNIETRLPKHAAILKKQWMEWLAKRYGTDENLQKAWGAGLREGDSITNPKMGLYGAWEMQAKGPERDSIVNEAERQRMGDFIRFLAETQRGYYARREQQLRDLGFKGVTVTTAWHAGGPAADPANTWCDSAMDMIDRHNYFGGGDGGHGITTGKVNNGTHLAKPGSGILASGMYQWEDRPFSMTEWTTLPPNQWKAEIAPLFAFYGMGLQGWDSSYHFAGARPRFGGGWPDLRSYVTETPHYLGQFPALAFALYKGHIKEAPLAAARRLKTEAIFQGIDALSQDFSGGGYDAKALKGNLATPMEVLAIGRVTTKIDTAVEPALKVDWAKYWDQDKQVVKSITGELTWDYAKKVATLHAAKTQSVIGFAQGGTFDLPGVKVDQVKTPFISLIFTPLDDKPLAESTHILVTAMAQDKQKGAEYNADGTQLIKTGEPILLMEPVQATLTLKGAPIKGVKVVDIYGVPTMKEVERAGNTFAIDGRYATYYYEITR